MTEASTQDVAADAGVSRRRAMLRAQRNALNVLDRSAFVRARSGLLLSGLALLGAYGGLAVALGWDSSLDAYDHPDPTAPLAFYYSGQAACGIDVLGSAVLLLAAWRWSRRRRRTALLDRTESARALTGAVPAYLATRYDARHGSATGRAVDLDAQPLIASGPELRFSLAGSIGFLVGMMTGIVGLVSLWDPVDPDTGPLNHGEFLGAVLALACGVVTLLAWCGISAAVGRSAVPRGIVQVEQAVYPLVPGDRVAERATGRFNGRTVGGVSAVVPLVLISTVRAVQDGLLGLVFPGLLWR